MSYVVEEKKEVNKKNSSNTKKTSTQNQKSKQNINQFNNTFRKNGIDNWNDYTNRHHINSNQCALFIGNYKRHYL